MEKQIDVDGKTYLVKEIKYKDLASLGDVSKEEAAKKMILLSTGITEEEYNELGLKSGIQIQKAINEINGLEDFRNPLVK